MHRQHAHTHSHKFSTCKPIEVGGQSILACKFIKNSNPSPSPSPLIIITHSFPSMDTIALSQTLGRTSELLQLVSRISAKFEGSKNLECPVKGIRIFLYLFFFVVVVVCQNIYEKQDAHHHHYQESQCKLCVFVCVCVCVLVLPCCPAGINQMRLAY